MLNDAKHGPTRVLGPPRFAARLPVSPVCPSHSRLHHGKTLEDLQPSCPAPVVRAVSSREGAEARNAPTGPPPSLPPQENPTGSSPAGEVSPSRLVCSAEPWSLAGPTGVAESPRMRKTWQPPSSGEGERKHRRGRPPRSTPKELRVEQRPQGHMGRCPPATNTDDVRAGAAIPPRGEDGRGRLGLVPCAFDTGRAQRLRRRGKEMSSSSPTRHPGRDLRLFRDS